MSGKFEQGCRVALLVEDDLELRLLLSKALQREGCSVIECKDGMELHTRVLPLLDAEDSMEYDLIITEIGPPKITGMEVVEGLSALKNSPPVVLISASGDFLTHERARRLGASAILDIPLDIKQFIKIVRETVADSRSYNRQKFEPVGTKILTI